MTTECTPTKRPAARPTTYATKAARIPSSAARAPSSTSASSTVTIGIQSTVPSRANTTAQTPTWAARSQSPARQSPQLVKWLRGLLRRAALTSVPKSRLRLIRSIVRLRHQDNRISSSRALTRSAETRNKLRRATKWSCLELIVGVAPEAPEERDVGAKSIKTKHGRMRAKRAIRTSRRSGAQSSSAAYPFLSILLVSLRLFVVFRM